MHIWWMREASTQYNIPSGNWETEAINVIQMLCSSSSSLGTSSNGEQARVTMVI